MKVAVVIKPDKLFLLNTGVCWLKQVNKLLSILPILPTGPFMSTLPSNYRRTAR